jgi:hypothetical protein
MITQWKPDYEPNTEYKTPNLIRKNAKFHLNSTAPAVDGWRDSQLEAAFNSGYNNRTPHEPENSSKPSGSARPAAPRPGLSTQQKGLVAFGVIAFATVAAVIILLLRTWKKRQVEGDPLPAELETNKEDGWENVTTGSAKNTLQGIEVSPNLEPYS